MSEYQSLLCREMVASVCEVWWQWQLNMHRKKHKYTNVDQHLYQESSEQLIQIAKYNNGK